MTETPPAFPTPGLTLLSTLAQGTTAIPKSIAKLIDTLGNQIGLYCEPHHIRAIAEAKADADLLAAKNQAAIQVIKTEGRQLIAEVQDRAAERLRAQQSRQQANIESIADMAAAEMPKDETQISDSPVDPDWTARFITKCQDVSNETMQRLWAKVLAGETTQPGSFSRKTLSIVEVMSKQDAELFTRLCSFILTIETSSTLVVVDAPATPTPSALAYGELLHLASLGLIVFDSRSQFTFSFTTVEEEELGTLIPLRYFGQMGVFQMKPKRQRAKNSIKPIALAEDVALKSGRALLTDAGLELAAIAGASRNELYLKSIRDFFLKQGWDLLLVPEGYELEEEPSE